MNDYNTNITENVKYQYAGGSNLNSRITLHQRFSTNKYNWFHWIFDQIDFTGKTHVLEVGCGMGQLWKSNAHRIPEGIKIVLTDLTQGMTDEAKSRLKGEGTFEFRAADAQDIPYENATFDIVIANHMLYHMPDRKKALAEINRVLKKGGILYATTNGENHMKDLKDIVNEFDHSIEYSLGAMSKNFGLENGEAQLKEFFGQVKVVRYKNSLDVTDVGAIVDYVASSKGWGNIEEKMTDGKKEEFRSFLSLMMADSGSIRIMTDSGMFIAAK